MRQAGTGVRYSMVFSFFGHKMPRIKIKNEVDKTLKKLMVLVYSSLSEGAKYGQPRDMAFISTIKGLQES